MNKLSLVFAFVVLFFSSVGFVKAGEEIDLGYAIDTNGKLVQGKKFIHYKKDFGEAKLQPVDRSAKAGGSCYNYLARGARWYNREPYLVDASSYENIISSDINKWEICQVVRMFLAIRWPEWLMVLIVLLLMAKMRLCLEMFQATVRLQ
jgi:hypothetical protein